MRNPSSRVGAVQYGDFRRLEPLFSPTKNFFDRNLLLRQLWVSGGSLDHRSFHDEVERQKRLRERYKRLKPQYPDKPPEWWFDTHDIEIADMEGQA